MSETKTFEELFLAQSEEDNLKVNHLKLLLINNINSNYMYLIKLKEWQIQHQQYFNYIIYLGNFLSYSENKKKDDVKQLSNDESEIGGLLSYLENLCLNIIYIGGNNDVSTIFNQPYPNLTLRSINLHNKFYELANDLYIIGYGGNIPMNTIDNELENSFSTLQKYIKENKNLNNFQTIFINNYFLQKNSNNINNFNESFYENIIKNKKNKVFLNLSGNIKQKKGIEKDGNLTIINPGSISAGDFVILNLERDVLNNSWKIQKIDYLMI